MKRPRTPLGRGNLRAVTTTSGVTPQQIRVELGIEDHPKTGLPAGYLKMGTIAIHFDADRADEYSTDFRRIALELRNEGQLT